MDVFVGRSFWLILPDTTYYEEGNEKGPELWLSGVKWWKLLAIDFSGKKSKDILDTRGRRNWPNISLSNEKSECNKLYHPYGGRISRPWLELPLDAFFTEVIGQTPNQNHPCRKLLKEFAQHPIQHQLGDPSCCIETWLALSWTLFLTEEIRVLAGEYSRTLRVFQNLVKESSLINMKYHMCKRGLWYAN